MNIPFRTKSLAFRVLSNLPGGALYFVQRHVTKRSQVRIRELHRGWAFHEESIRMSDARRLVEFGAGKTLAQNLYLSRNVEAQTVVDLFPMLELPMLNQAVQQLCDLGVALDRRQISNLDDLEQVHSIRYLAPYDMAHTSFPNESFDICVSTNTLEHIPRCSIERIFRELFRLLRPGGQVSAMIDYSDHYAHSDPSITRLHFLQFSEAAYARHNHSNHFQNRLRHDHYRTIFEAAGFSVLSDTATDVCDPAGLALNADLLTGNEADYATTGFWRLEKPAGCNS
jgi:SAM-dependent methyltransferase